MFCQTTLKLCPFALAVLSSRLCLLPSVDLPWLAAIVASAHRRTLETKGSRPQGEGSRRVERCRKVTLMAMPARDNTRYSWNHKFMISPFYQHVYNILHFFIMSPYKHVVLEHVNMSILCVRELHSETSEVHAFG